MAEVKYFGKSPREIAEKYFDKANLIKEGRTEQEIEALYDGFVEGLTYIYPMYHNSELLVELLTQTKPLDPNFSKTVDDNFDNMI